MGSLRTVLVVLLVVVAVGLVLHFFGPEVMGWMASLHGRPPSH
jgi:hypothetical protein